MVDTSAIALAPRLLVKNFINSVLDLLGAIDLATEISPELVLQLQPFLECRLCQTQT